MQNGKVAQFFKLTWSTWIFILINVATFGLFYLIWIWKFINKISPDFDRSTNRTLTIIAFSCFGWMDVIGEIEEEMGTGGALSGLFYLAYLVLIITLSFRTKKSFEQFLFNNNYKIVLNGFWCFLIPFWYQYYIAFNAEEIWQKKCLQAAPAPQANDVSDKIAKLKEMLDNGTISEEEFETAKKKLLS